MQSIRGTKDYFGLDVQKFDFIVNTAIKISSKYGYSRIITPIIENTELFNRIGESSDIVSKEMYTFEDKGGRSITLIPEGTTPVARAVIQHSIQIPARLYYISPMFRYERPQQGRYRQLHQIGLEFIGSESYFADLELISIATEILDSLNVKYDLELNYIGSYENRKCYLLELKNFIHKNLYHFCINCNRRLEKNTLRIFDCKEKECNNILEKAPVIIDYLSHEEREDFKNIQEVIRLKNIKFNINHRIVRGLDYYTNLVFEVKDENGLAILGGGRYNNLYKEMGKEFPAVGLGIGIERLINILPPYHKKLNNLCIIIMNKNLITNAFLLANKIRKEELSVVVNYEINKLKKQLSKASKLDTEYSIIFGENELKDIFKLRNTNTGEVTEVNYIQLIDVLKRGKRCIEHTI